MGTSLSYYDMAENDYQFLKQDKESGRVGNIMCYASQNICERYLKHVIEISVIDCDTTSVLRTHSIRNLKRFIMCNVPRFSCDWSVIMQCDGFYYSARYPGDDSLIADVQDVEECWEAVEETRRSVIKYLENQNSQNQNPQERSIFSDSQILESMKFF